MNLKINQEKNTILLLIQEPSIPGKIVEYAESYQYSKKPEFHISIISFQNGKRILDKYGKDNKIFEEVLELVGQFNWDYEITSEYYEIEKFYSTLELEKSGYKDISEHTRRSIIQKIFIPEIDLFYDKLSSMTGIVFEKPFCHITLYSWADLSAMVNQGIGLYSESDFYEYKKASL